MFFLFKQKTAYEITHSDWSSDVCSSDLSAVFTCRGPAAPLLDNGRWSAAEEGDFDVLALDEQTPAGP